jgi:tetratricopeptide (TPR) repeat protein
MKTRKLPHFPRFFSALFTMCIYSVFLGGLVWLFVINISYVTRVSSGELQTKIAAIREQYNPTVHVTLARLYWNTNMTIDAERELQLAHSFNWPKSSTGQSPDRRVLGISNDPLDFLTQWKSETQKIEKQYVYWKTVAEEKPDYIDAHLLTAQLAYQMGNTEEAYRALAKAKKLDPTNPRLIALEKMITDK